MKDVCILLVLYNDKEHLPNLVNSLKEQSYQNFDVFAIDCSESQESINCLLKLWPKVITLPYSGNLGYSGANNLLFERSSNRYSYGAVLNTDVILENNYIEVQRNILNGNTQFALSSSIVYRGRPGAENGIQNYGISANFKKAYAVFDENYSTDSDFLKTDIVPGCVFMFRYNMIKEVGLFPQENFMYGEEIDLAYRIKAKNYCSAITNKCKAWHNHDWGSQNRSGENRQYYYSMRNRFLFLWRHKKYLEVCYNFLEELIYLPYKIYWVIKKNNIGLIKYYYKGVFHGLFRISGKRL